MGEGVGDIYLDVSVFQAFDLCKNPGVRDPYVMCLPNVVFLNVSRKGPVLGCTYSQFSVQL